jgi:hypothetical protein
MKLEMEVSFPEDVAERLTVKATEMNLRPEQVVTFIVATVLGGNDVEDEVSGDAELAASLRRAQADIAAGRIVSHEEILEWHRNHPE